MGLTIPTIHLNGTSRESLVSQYADAASAVNTGIRALCENGPNARDYYVTGMGTFEKAVAEHVARIAKMQEVLNELHALMYACEDNDDD